MSWLFGGAPNPATAPAAAPKVTQVKPQTVKVTKSKIVSELQANSPQKMEAPQINSMASAEAASMTADILTTASALDTSMETHILQEVAKARTTLEEAPFSTGALEDQIKEELNKAIATSAESKNAALEATKAEAQLAQQKVVDDALHQTEMRLTQQHKADLEAALESRNKLDRHSGEERVAQAVAQASAAAAVAIEAAKAEMKSEQDKVVAEAVQAAEERLTSLHRAELESVRANAETALEVAVTSAVENTRAALTAELSGLSEHSDAAMKMMQKAHESDKAVALAAAAKTHNETLKAAVIQAQKQATRDTETKLGSQHETTLAASALLLRQTQERAAKELKEAVAAAVAQTMTDTEARLQIKHEEDIKRVLLEERGKSVASLETAVRKASAATEEGITMTLLTQHETKMDAMRRKYDEDLAARDRLNKELEHRLELANASLKASLARLLPAQIKEPGSLL